MYTVLYVDDEPQLLDLGKLFLERTTEFHVEIASSAKDALASPAIQSYDAIVSDYQMPDMDGIAFLKAVRERFGDVPFILFTGRGREDVVIDAINNGADFYLQKGGISNHSLPNSRTRYGRPWHGGRPSIPSGNLKSACRTSSNSCRMPR